MYLVVILLLLIGIVLIWGESFFRFCLERQELPEEVRYISYYCGYFLLLIHPSNLWSEETIETQEGFRLFGSYYSSTLIKCYRLSQSYEPSLVRYLDGYLDSEKVFVDVGANEGYFSLLAASRGCQVKAIEPSEDNLYLLRRNADLNGYSSCLEIFPYAVGKQNQETDFRNSLFNGMWSSVGSGRTASLFERETRVEMYRLEDLISSIPDIVKIDVEGLEWEVIQGCYSWLEAKKSLWLVEADDYTLEGRLLVDMFLSLGYKAYSLPVDSVALPEKIYLPEKYFSGQELGFRNFIFKP